MPVFDRHRQVGHHGQRERDHPDRLVGPVEPPDAADLPPLAHVVGDDEQDGGQRRQRDMKRRAAPAAARSTSSVTACTMPATGVRAPDRKLVAVRAMAPVTGMPPTSGDDEVGDALRQQFGVRVVPVAGHRVGHDRRQQALDGRQQRDRQRRRQQRQDQVGAELRDGDRRQAARDAAEPRADRLDGQAEQRNRRRAGDQRHDRSRHARQPRRHQQHERQRSGRERRRASGSTDGRRSAIARHPREELARDPRPASARGSP